MVSICIVTYNRNEDLKNCLQSIRDSVTIAHETIVVDNCSTDGTKEMVRSQFPEVTMIENRENRYFSPAMNQAWLAARGNYVLNLSSDSVLKLGTVRTMVDFLEEHPDVGIAGPRTYDAHGDIVTTCHSPNIMLGVLSNLFFVTQFIRGNKAVLRLFRAVFKNRTGFTNDYSVRREVEVIDGAGIMLRRELIERVGSLDEHLFFGPDDYDFCLRVRKKGYMIWFLPEAEAVHKTHGRLNLDLPASYIRTVYPSWCYVFKKHSSTLTFRFLKVLLATGLFVRAAFSRLRLGRKGGISQAYYETARQCLLYK